MAPTGAASCQAYEQNRASHAWNSKPLPMATAHARWSALPPSHRGFSTSSAAERDLREDPFDLSGTAGHDVTAQQPSVERAETFARRRAGSDENSANTISPLSATSSAGRFDLNYRLATDTLRDEGRYRVFQNVNRIAEKFPHAVWHAPDGTEKDVVTWCTNDYLGMGQTPEVMSAIQEAVQCAGTGSGGTRNISGTNAGHVQLEEELADLHGKEAALVFSSCFVANDALLSTLPMLMPDLHVFSDQGNHASIIQGIKHAGPSVSKAVYRHNDVDHLDELLSNAPSSASKLVVFESVYSMSGTVSDIGATCDVSPSHVWELPHRLPARCTRQCVD